MINRIEDGKEPFGEAYLSKDGKTIIIATLTGYDLKEDHNCDQMGCAAWHVVYRLPVPVPVGDMVYIPETDVPTLHKEIERLRAQLGLERTRADLEKIRADALVVQLDTVRDATIEELANTVPTSWLDPLLSGPDKAVKDPPLDGSDIENLCMAIQRRLRALKSKAANGEKI